MAATKYSRQRESILHYLRSTKCHPTAEVIFQNVRSVCPSISQGTVYRNLKLLSGTGEIQRITCGDGVEHYDATVTLHYHLYCGVCGQVVDIDMPPMVEVEMLAQRYYPGNIEGHTTLFYGHCPECSKSDVESCENDGE